MKIADQVEIQGMSLRTAGFACVAAAVCVLAAMPAMAQSGAAQDQDQRSGVSHPPSAPILADDDTSAPAPPAKPSPMVPMTDTTAAAAKGSVIPAGPGEVYGAYVPYQAPGTAAASDSAKSSLAFDPDANIVTEASAGRAQRRELGDAASKNDPDAGIVFRKHEFLPGDMTFIPRHRLHGSVVLSGECVYHQPVITSELDRRFG